jgi:hypothetical protein
MQLAAGRARAVIYFFSRTHATSQLEIYARAGRGKLGSGQESNCVLVRSRKWPPQHQHKATCSELDCLPGGLQTPPLQRTRSDERNPVGGTKGAARPRSNGPVQEAPHTEKLNTKALVLRVEIRATRTLALSPTGSSGAALTPTQIQTAKRALRREMIPVNLPVVSGRINTSL